MILHGLELLRTTGKMLYQGVSHQQFWAREPRSREQGLKSTGRQLLGVWQNGGKIFLNSEWSENKDDKPWDVCIFQYMKYLLWLARIHTWIEVVFAPFFGNADVFSLRWLTINILARPESSPMSCEQCILYQFSVCGIRELTSTLLSTAQTELAGCSSVAAMGLIGFQNP